jgi:hypothetical protein
MSSAFTIYVPLETLVKEAAPFSSVNTNLEALEAPFAVREAVAKPTGSAVLESTSFSFTVNDPWAKAEKEISNARIKAAIRLETGEVFPVILGY